MGYLSFSHAKVGDGGGGGAEVCNRFLSSTKCLTLSLECVCVGGGGVDLEPGLSHVVAPLSHF